MILVSTCGRSPPIPRCSASPSAAVRPGPAPAFAAGLLDRDQLHVDAGSPGQIQQVAGVGGEDIVPVLREADDGHVDGTGIA
jgi:hypothetical protein